MSEEQEKNEAEAAGTPKGGQPSILRFEVYDKDVELDLLAPLEFTECRRRDVRVVGEHVGAAAVLLDKPKPFSELNHFTIPVAMPLPGRGRGAHRARSLTRSWRVEAPERAASTTKSQACSATLVGIRSARRPSRVGVAGQPSGTRWDRLAGTSSELSSSLALSVGVRLGRPFPEVLGAGRGRPAPVLPQGRSGPQPLAGSFSWGVWSMRIFPRGPSAGSASSRSARVYSSMRTRWVIAGSGW